jgi:DNA-binding response OmpR family regulator
MRRAVLEEAGFEVLTAASAEEALDMTRFRRFAALVVDPPGYQQISPRLRRLRELAAGLPLVVAPVDTGKLRRMLDAIAPLQRRAA